MNIFGGHADFVHANNLSTLNVSGGTFGSFWAHDSSTVTVCGGSLPVWAEQDSRAEISGGTILFIKAGDAGGSHHSVVTISGTGFNYPYGEIPDMSGTLTGVLANGDPINASFEIYDNASIVLVPEQAALVLLSIGAAGLVSWARVRRSRPRCTGTVCVSVPRLLAALVAGALVLGLAGPLQAGWFLTWLDPLPGDDSGLPYAVSADGSTIVGQSSRGAYHSDYRPEAFRWTPSGGMAGLGFLPGHAWSEAHGVSADGSVVVGYSQAAIGEHMHAGGEAFRWTEDTGPVGLGHLQGDDLSWAYGVSADGSVVVGYSGNMGWNDTAFLWTRQGKMTALPLPAGGAWSRAMAVSATGSVVAGEWGTDNSHEGAFRWTADLGSVGLNSPPGGGMDYVCGLSADGSVIVGEGSDGRAARWTETEGLLYLVSPAQDPDHSAATAVSDDGSFIVGYGHSVTPFLWDAAHGARDLGQLLVADGVELGQGFLLTARDVSFDGQTIVIVGEGVDPNGAGLKVWMARALIPEPSTAALVSLAAVGLAARFGRERKKPQGPTEKPSVTGNVKFEPQ
jgi:probable HAF family extracellular repeat protein